jgi:hypothetical protein
MIQAKYRLSGIDNRIVTASSRIGRVHLFFTNLFGWRWRTGRQALQRQNHSGRTSAVPR